MCIKRKHPHYFILNVPIPALASLLLIMAALLTGCGSPPLSPANRNHGKSIQEPGENALSAKASTQPPKSLSEAPATGNLELASFKPDFLIVMPEQLQYGKQTVASQFRKAAAVFHI